MRIKTRRTAVCLPLFILIWTLLPAGSLAEVEPVYRVDTEEKVVAITFDDGPDPEYTPLILETLHEHRVAATFFVLGQQAEKYPAVIRWMHRAGHEIGNHGYHHYDLNELSQEQVFNEIRKTEKVIHRITGTVPEYYRPPGGVMTPAVLGAVQRAEYALIRWSVDPKDWKRKRTSEVIASSVKHEIDPGDIVLFHDGGLNQEETLQALKELIVDLRKDGYEFVTVSELLNMRR